MMMGSDFDLKMPLRIDFMLLKKYVLTISIADEKPEIRG